ncbi:MAG: PKD domain-containing protein, partial [Acidobacteriota bacterium]|nr:PKD domain-containing protein [Acidobacteriota bacterium]
SATSSYADFDVEGTGWMRFADMDLTALDLTAREKGTLELVNCTGATVEQEDPTATVIQTDFDADFTASDLSGGVPLTVDFLDLSGGVISSHSWSFGDGGSSTGQTPSHQYTSPREYSVSLTLRSPSSDSTESKVDYISVSETLRPHIRTEAATEIGETSATLTGVVNPNGGLTTAFFDWGPTAAYGSTEALGSVGSGNMPLAISTDLTSLVCGASYHFRARAMNSSGTQSGTDESFSTRICDTLDLTDVWISQAATYEACSTIRAGPNVRIQAPGSCVFRAGETVEFRNGFSVEPNAPFTVENLLPLGCGAP